MEWPSCSLPDEVLVCHAQPSSEVPTAPAADRQQEAGSGGRPRVMLLCGADLVESFVTPGVWRQEHLAQILGQTTASSVLPGPPNQYSFWSVIVHGAHHLR